MILRALERQTVKDFEVIIAEDDEAADTVDYLAKQVVRMPFPILHVCQHDKGFRKNRILNKAVAASTGDLIVFLDGDCVPHRKWLEEYSSQADKNVVLSGRRLMVSEILTQTLLRTKKLSYLSLIYQLRYGSNNLEEGIYLPFYRRPNISSLLGCNWAILKKHLIAVNGFDEDYVSPGVGEDLDIAWRLAGNGIMLRSMRHRAIVYHLHHRAHYCMGDVVPNYDIMRKKQALGSVYCVNGLDKHLPKK
jgi:cellulose synthase/poly-beta-1,6-N-acetylglucosamine synthase-like glycosyltransferase